jgi:hypothetical protein
MHRVGACGPPWTDGGAHQSLAFGHSGALKLTGGGATERGEHEELGSGFTGARAAVWQPDDAVVVGEAWWGGVLMRERRREELGEVWNAPGVVGVAFIGPGEGCRGGKGGVMAGEGGASMAE